jgi:hypothetical protein
MAADSALGGVIEKNGDHLPDKTLEILKAVQAKFQAKPGAEPPGHGGSGGNAGGNGGGNGGGVGNGAGKGGSGHDTQTDGHDTTVGGQAAGVSVTDLGTVKLPDLSGIKAVGGVAPVDLNSLPPAASAADAAIAKAAPAAHVDLTLVGQSVEALTKKLAKLGDGP